MCCRVWASVYLHNLHHTSYTWRPNSQSQYQKTSGPEDGCDSTGKVWDASPDGCICNRSKRVQRYLKRISSVLVQCPIFSMNVIVKTECDRPVCLFLLHALSALSIAYNIVYFNFSSPSKWDWLEKTFILVLGEIADIVSQLLHRSNTFRFHTALVLHAKTVTSSRPVEMQWLQCLTTKAQIQGQHIGCFPANV